MNLVSILYENGLKQKTEVNQVVKMNTVIEVNRMIEYGG